MDFWLVRKKRLEQLRIHMLPTIGKRTEDYKFPEDKAAASLALWVLRSQAHRRKYIPVWFSERLP